MPYIDSFVYHVQVKVKQSHYIIDIENQSNTIKGDLLLHRATSFDPTLGSSSGRRLNKN
jgi:hypothetical protein